MSVIVLTSYKCQRFEIIGHHSFSCFLNVSIHCRKITQFSKMAKIALFCVILCVYLQVAFTSPRVSRDAAEPKTPDVSKEIDDALKVLKTNFDHVVKTVQDNDMFKELNEKIQKFSAEIAAQGKQLADKLHDAAIK